MFWKTKNVLSSCVCVFNIYIHNMTSICSLSFKISVQYEPRMEVHVIVVLLLSLIVGRLDAGLFKIHVFQENYQRILN